MKKQAKKKTTTTPSKQTKLILGIILIGIGIFLFISFFSFMMNWKVDQSQLQLSNLFNKDIIAQNALGKVGNFFGQWFVGLGIGITAFLFPILLILAGIRIGFNIKLVSLKKYFAHSVFFLFWLPVLLALIVPTQYALYGVTGFEFTETLKSMLGVIGIAILLFISIIIYGVVSFKPVFELFSTKFIQSSKEKLNNLQETLQNESLDEETQEKEETLPTEKNTSKPLAQETITDEEMEPTLVQKPQEVQTVDLSSSPEEPQEPEYLDDLLESIDLKEDTIDLSTDNTSKPTSSSPSMEIETPKEEVSMSVETVKEEVTIEKNLANQLVSEYGEYDPTLDLSKYQFPTIDMLKRYDNEDIMIDQNELEANKNKIVETLSNYKIAIAKIKATVGPTITLYEIVPEAGVRISKIKNLEDDIALSLSALGIRIIAPIPGKGTIGIEVPNKNARIVSMHSVIASEKFQNDKKMALPVAFGKTISNETFVVDLAKMPHLLMAGATGQGKSVGLNAILASLLYKKHPSELKFVLVDPKKVELTLYSKIERHYLAKLPDSEEAIITDNTKVINTLNSLCIEMDNRYELLKNAMVRNIIEYNEKFKQRKLNPADGHRFLPYIVLVVDEFADLIMTAGKEVETPVARLAQLARAIGIHLIVATQRPSVNVITGIIKANFPARVAFRVTSKIDSRTILDAGGADQLIGRGDMLYSTGNELVRLQCAFVDTPEVEEICDFIGNQKGYPNALLLPEYVGEESSAVDVDLDDRDKLFEDAARLIVMAQQGSASLLQRKLKLGYNRAGRIIDQLEAAGIVGQFEGSKARQVLIQDENSLEQLLDSLK
ncbi:DNA translocase FtsK [Flavobacteriaceae bacterium UJ101]|nr:DNA translocase FtsK [Flavobacteriaceae bacterium UJ101]